MNFEYKCGECGHVFETPARWKESRGEFWGMPAFEEMFGCPKCHSTDYDLIDEEREENESCD